MPSQPGWLYHGEGKEDKTGTQQSEWPSESKDESIQQLKWPSDSKAEAIQQSQWPSDSKAEAIQQSEAIWQ